LKQIVKYNAFIVYGINLTPLFLRNASIKSITYIFSVETCHLEGVNSAVSARRTIMQVEQEARMDSKPHRESWYIRSVDGVHVWP